MLRRLVHTTANVRLATRKMYGRRPRKRARTLMNAPLAHTLVVPMPSAPITMAATLVIVMPVTNVAHGQPLKRTALILMSVLVTISVALSALAQTKSVHMSVSATVATKRMYGQQRQTHAKVCNLYEFIF